MTVSVNLPYEPRGLRLFPCLSLLSTKHEAYISQVRNLSFREEKVTELGLEASSLYPTSFLTLFSTEERDSPTAP